MIKLQYYLLAFTFCTLLSCSNKQNVSADTDSESLAPASSLLNSSQEPELPVKIVQETSPPSQHIQVASSAVAEQPSATQTDAVVTKTAIQSAPQVPIVSDPVNQLTEQWKQIILNKFHQDKTPRSFVFEWYTEYLLNEMGKNLGPNSYWGNPSKTQITKIFSELVKLHSQTQKEWTEKFPEGYRAKIQGEKVLFLTSFDAPVSSIPPSRVAIVHTQGLLPFFTQKESHQKIEAQANTLSAWVNHIHEHKLPVHIMGKCDYICSTYLAPRAKEIYIEPFGEILFNGDLPTTYYIANNLFQLIKKAEGHYRRDTFNDQNILAQFIQQGFEWSDWESLITQLEISRSHQNAFIIRKIRKALNLVTDPIDIKTRTTNKPSIRQTENLMSSMSLRDIETITEFIRTSNNDANNDSEQQFANIKKMEEAIEGHLQGLNVFNTSYTRNAIIPDNSYSARLNNFAYTTGLVTGSTFVQQITPSYSIEGHGLSYGYVSPQVAFLAKLGFNVKLGKNSGLRRYVLSPEEVNNILPVNETTLSDCDFRGAFYITTPLLQSCINL